ncbi:MAG TPA: chromosome segregation protein SMC, partial [Cyanobacteria bacterium UBA11049]|nr:chromosome segregation protein SMC [Cyanobacteria bacterium UBA11049]
IKLQQLNRDLQKSERDYQTAVDSYQKAEAEFLSFRTELTSARQQDRAAALRMLLHSGDNCPVCGGVYPETHLLPVLATSFDIKALEKRDRIAEEKRQTAAANKTKAETTQENLKQQLDDAERALTTIEDELTAISKQINNILSNQEWELKTLKIEHKALQESDAKYQEILRIKEKIEAEFKNSELNFDYAQQKLREVRSQHQDAVTEVERQKTKLQQIVAKLFDIAGGQSYHTLLQQLERDKRNLVEKIEQVNQSYQAARDKFIQTQQEDTKAKEDFKSVATEKVKLEAEWQTRLLAKKLTEKIFLKSQAAPELQNKWQEKIETYEQKKIQLETLVQQETEEVGGKTTNVEIIAKLETAVSAADANRKSSQDEYEQLKVWIAKAEDNRQQAKKLQTELSKKQQELETYRTLAKELKSDRFQAYILQHFERELVAQATVLLRELTEQRYALKYDEKEYYVEDRWSGGEARRVQTLSGGETFATSLSLALALSEKLSGGAKLGSLFIDEGFGTLDAETLESVCNILQSLGQQDRLVGVITHVPALGEQLGTQIKVEKLPEGSQIIKPFV